MNRLIECFRIARLSALKYLSSMTEEESAALEEWVEESAARREGLERMEQRLMEDLRKGRELEAEEEWRLFQKRLPRRNFFRRWAYAAAVAAGIGITAGGIFLLREEKPVRMTQSVEHNVKEYKAKLILADGNEWNITDKEQHIIDVAQGTRVTTSGKGMTYEVSDSAVSASAPGSRNTLIVPRGGEFELVLADGTQVWVNADSELKYPVRFSGGERKVYLKGEAYFDVAKRDGQKFLVCTNGTEVTVLGTEFNVKNYPGGGMATTLVEGSVVIGHGGQECRLRPGQQAYVDRTGVQVREVETVLYTAWKDGFFVYRDMTLDGILKELSRWYDFSYFYRNERLQALPLTAKIRKFDDVEKVFEILKSTGQVDFVIKGKTVTVLSK